MVDRSWAAYDRIVHASVGVFDLDEYVGIPIMPHIRAAQGISRTAAWIMKAGMRLSGYDDALVRTEMARRRTNTRK